MTLFKQLVASRTMVLTLLCTITVAVQGMTFLVCSVQELVYSVTLHRNEKEEYFCLNLRVTTISISRPARSFAFEVQTRINLLVVLF